MVENAGLGIAMGKSFLEQNRIGNVFVSDNNEDRSSRSNKQIY